MTLKMIRERVKLKKKITYRNQAKGLRIKKSDTPLIVIYVMVNSLKCKIPIFRILFGTIVSVKSKYFQFKVSNQIVKCPVKNR